MKDFDTPNIQEEKLFSPEEKPFESSYQDYVVSWWKWLISIPKELNPDGDDTGERSTYGQNPMSPIFFLSTWKPRAQS